MFSLLTANLKSLQNYSDSLSHWIQFIEFVESCYDMSDQRGQMVVIPAGTYRVGSESFYPEEAPIRSIQLQSFVIDVAPVTNAEFARFVADTGYQTVSEKPPDPELYPNLPPEQQRPESAVFTPPPASVDRSQPLSWWAL